MAPDGYQHNAERKREILTICSSTGWVYKSTPIVSELEEKIVILQRELKTARAEIFRLRNQQRRGR